MLFNWYNRRVEATVTVSLSPPPIPTNPPQPTPLFSSPPPHPHRRQNCILADEMGLGKTIQSIAFLQEVSNVGIRGPFLVIAPLSTITNWEREFNTWTEMNSIVYHGSLASRQMIQQYEMYCKDSRVRGEGGNPIKTPPKKRPF